MALEYYPRRYPRQLYRLRSRYSVSRIRLEPRASFNVSNSTLSTPASVDENHDGDEVDNEKDRKEVSTHFLARFTMSFFSFSPSTVLIVPASHIRRSSPTYFFIQDSARRGPEP